MWLLDGVMGSERTRSWGDLQSRTNIEKASCQSGSPSSDAEGYRCMSTANIASHIGSTTHV